MWSLFDSQCRLVWIVFISHAHIKSHIFICQMNIQPYHFSESITQVAPTELFPGVSNSLLQTGCPSGATFVHFRRTSTSLLEKSVKSVVPAVLFKTYVICEGNTPIVMLEKLNHPDAGENGGHHAQEQNGNGILIPSRCWNKQPLSPQ